MVTQFTPIKFQVDQLAMQLVELSLKSDTLKIYSNSDPKKATFSTEISKEAFYQIPSYHREKLTDTV